MASSAAQEVINPARFGLAGSSIREAANDNDSDPANDNVPLRAANDNSVSRALTPMAKRIASNDNGLGTHRVEALLETTVKLLGSIDKSERGELLLEQKDQEKRREDFLERPSLSASHDVGTQVKQLHADGKSSGGMSGLIGGIAGGIGPLLMMALPAVIAALPVLLAGAGGVALLKALYDHAGELKIPGGGANYSPAKPGRNNGFRDAVDANETIVASGSHQNLKKIIQQGESKGNPNIMQGAGNSANKNGVWNSKSMNLETMTVAQVLELQDKVDSKDGKIGRGGATGAAGLYQVIPATLRGIIKSGVIRSTDKFDRNTQEKIGDYLIAQRWKAAKGNKLKFMEGIAAEWRSLPSTISNPGGVYGAKGRASQDRVSHSVADVSNAITADSNIPASSTRPAPKKNAIGYKLAPEARAAIMAFGPQWTDQAIDNLDKEQVKTLAHLIRTKHQAQKVFDSAKRIRTTARDLADTMPRSFMGMHFDYDRASRMADGHTFDDPYDRQTPAPKPLPAPRKPILAQPKAIAAPTQTTIRGGDVTIVQPRAAPQKTASISVPSPGASMGGLEKQMYFGTA